MFLKSADLAPSSISQVKILRSTDRLDGHGLGRSKGYGFIEFKGHEDALKALRCTNNNPELFGEKRVSGRVCSNHYFITYSCSCTVCVWSVCLYKLNMLRASECKALNTVGTSECKVCLKQCQLSAL